MDPTRNPTQDPTQDPTKIPSQSPSSVPTSDPTLNPTIDLTYFPSHNPTNDPPTEPSLQPTTEPSMNPTDEPSMDPTHVPTLYPSVTPTTLPTGSPESSIHIYHSPTREPTAKPTSSPTMTYRNMLFLCEYNDEPKTYYTVHITLIQYPELMIDGLTAKNIIGVEAALWGETIKSMSDAQYMIFPRLLSLSEVAWSPQEQRSWSGFSKRLAQQLDSLEQQGLNYRPLAKEGLLSKQAKSSN